MASRTRQPARPSVQQEAYEGFPYGMLVLDQHGRIVSRNGAAKKLIAEMDLPASDLTCCTLLGCRRAQTALAGACVCDLVLKRKQPLPEFRLDLATRAGGIAVWVTAGRLGGRPTRVVLQLRPGVARDPATGKNIPFPTGRTLRICTMGETLVESPAGPIQGPWLDQRTGQLLKYLVAERHREVSVDEIGESIWVDASYGIAGSVRYYIHALRRKLEPERGLRAPSAFIGVKAGSYSLNLDHVDVDADEVEFHLLAGLAAAEADPHAAMGEIECGLDFYRGDFLADVPYAEWAMSERHHLHALACTGLRRLVDMRLRLGLVDSAEGSLEHLARLQPFDDDVHRQLMELDIMQGRRSDALRRYGDLRTRIRRTFGHDPGFTPAELARSIPELPRGRRVP